ncbi:MAG: TraB/GumN family protein [Ruminococcaceae bacterium]|nr:TraB/GumN family protein [Oscillospiraceae bacterium]
MKKTFFVVLSLALLLTGCAADTQEPSVTTLTTQATEAPAPAEPASTSSTPLLYRITDEEGHILYLLGSAHAGLKEMYPLPDYVLDAFESADALALEANPSFTGVSLEEYAMVEEATTLEKGKTIRDYISQQTYDEAVKILEENNQYSAAMDQRTPVVWMMAIDQLIVRKCESAPNYGVDNMLMNMAKNSKKPIVNAETYVNHNAPLTDVSMNQQIKLLERVVVAYQDSAVPPMRDSICKMWAAGDKSAMKAQLAVDPFMWALEDGELAAYQEYWEILGNQRDNHMVHYIKDTLASGDTVFVCVGAAHVIADNGIVDQMIQAGYTVEQVK